MLFNNKTEVFIINLLVIQSQDMKIRKVKIVMKIIINNLNLIKLMQILLQSQVFSMIIGMIIFMNKRMITRNQKMKIHQLMMIPIVISI
jgi:hypothetical protein